MAWKDAEKFGGAACRSADASGLDHDRRSSSQNKSLYSFPNEKHNAHRPSAESHLIDLPEANYPQESADSLQDKLSRSTKSVRFEDSKSIVDDDESLYSSEEDDLFDDYYADSSRTSLNLSRGSHLPKIIVGGENGRSWWGSSRASHDASRPFSAFSIGRLVDMYTLNSPVAGMGSPVSPNPHSLTSIGGGWSSVLRTKHRQPTFSPMKSYPFNSVFATSTSGPAGPRPTSPQPPRSPVSLQAGSQIPIPAHPNSSLHVPPQKSPSSSPPPPSLSRSSRLLPAHPVPLQRPVTRYPPHKPSLEPQGVRHRARGFSLYGEIMRMELKPSQPAHKPSSALVARSNGAQPYGTHFRSSPQRI